LRLKASSLSWALKHVCKEGDTELFPQPFEFDVIKEYWPMVVKDLGHIQINAHTWQGPRRLIVPKSEFGFRTVCQLDPLDSILFAAIAREIGAKIERHRLSDNAVFSYRFDPNNGGRLYAAATGWENFWKTSSRYCDEFSYVLITDISDYYNQIYHHTIENQLDQCRIDKAYWHGLRNLLANVTEGVSRGVPIGPHPSHLIAEMAMIPADHFMQSMDSGPPFACRAAPSSPFSSRIGPSTDSQSRRSRRRVWHQPCAGHGPSRDNPPADTPHGTRPKLSFTNGVPRSVTWKVRSPVLDALIVAASTGNIGG
jgi:hypothetical protein